MSALAHVLLGLAAGAWLAARTHVLLHILQQEHYEHSRLSRWLDGAPERRARRETAAVAAALGIAAVAIALSSAAGVAIAAVALVAGALRAREAWRRPQVKPLVFTPRARRILAVALALVLVPAAAAALLVPEPASAFTVAALGVAGYALAPSLLALALRVLVPVQRADNRRFERRARARLREVDPIVAGITGSFGKTTTKACLAAVLDLIGPSYPTPASFNSLLGVVRAINEGLEPQHRSFVVEMGAYREGDVRELCELVSPTLGILTTVGPAHLERFGTIEAIARAKGELAESLPADGHFVTRADNPYCLEIAATRTRARTILFASRETEGADVWARDVAMQGGRTTFTLCARSEQAGVQEAEVRARLLGEHNVANLLAAAAAGIALGLEPREIARALSRVTPPAHRLQPIVNTASGVVVIDDSYNSNPEGAAAALEVLAAHEADRRVLVTPGMVELGELEESENRRLGELAAQACDRVILIGGRRAGWIREGLLATGFDEEAIVDCADAATAHRTIAETTQRGDVILFENDLPDVYAG